jgi:hypothetical protein
VETELDLFHVLGLGTLLPLDHFELDFLAFFQALEAFTRDVAVVHEDIGTIGLGNKAVTFGITEPLDLASYSHYDLQEIPGKKIGVRPVKAPFWNSPTGPAIA